MTEYRLTITAKELGRLDENGDRVLTGFEQRHADLGPVVAQNTETGILDVTIALDAPSLKEAIDAGFKAFTEGMIDAGFLGVDAESIEAEPVEREPELAPAAP